MSATGGTKELHSPELSAIERGRQHVADRARALPVRRRGWLMRRMLLVADVTGLLIAYVLSVTVPLSGSHTADEAWKALAFVATLPIWVMVAKILGLYDCDEERTDHNTAADLPGVFHLVTTGAWVTVVVRWVTPLNGVELERMIVFWGVAIVLVMVARATTRALCRRSASYIQRVVIVGTDEIGQLIGRKIVRHPEYGLNVVGFVDTASPDDAREGEPPFLGTPPELRGIVSQFDVERVIFACGRDDEEIVLLARELRDLDVQIDIVPRMFELVGPRVGIHSVEGFPLLGVPPARLSRSSRALKRAVDVCLAAVGLFVLAPLFAFIAVRVRLDSPGPVFFRQTRLGMGMREFTFLKFRTMYVGTGDAEHREYIKESMNPDLAAEGNGLYKLERKDAVTRFGAFLRRTSLDELPQLINVLRGDMSLVGPRPCIPYETEEFEPHHFDRFLVPAGLTGLWQVTARAHSTFGEALDMDVAYAHGCSLGLDLRLLLLTPVRALTGETR